MISCFFQHITAAGLFNESEPVCRACTYGTVPYCLYCLGLMITALLSCSLVIKMNQCCCIQGSSWLKSQEPMDSSDCSLIELQLLNTVDPYG
jgi:hypothetical protein